MADEGTTSSPRVSDTPPEEDKDVETKVEEKVEGSDEDGEDESPRAQIMEVLKEIDLEKNPIGTGSFGKVYKGVWTRKEVSQPVAVKIFPLKRRESESAFEAEVRMSVLLQDNPRCVSIKKAYVSKNKGYLVMDLLASDLMSIQGKLSFKEDVARPIFKQICSSIKKIHQKNIVHMDIKPENILLDKEGDTYLADFGSSAIVPMGGRFKSAAGTVEYAAPEVLSGAGPYNPYPADIWSLGIMFYTMVTGKYPKIKKKKYPVHSKLSADLNDLLSNMLTHIPEKRPNIHMVICHPWFCSKSAPAEASKAKRKKSNSKKGKD